MSKTFNIKVTEETLEVMMCALECYSRLGINQFGYCLEHNPAFGKLGYEKRHEIENFLKSHIDSRNFGIYHPEVTTFNKAFQIKKEIQKVLAISKNPIVDHFTNEYDGALGDYDYVPKFYDDDGNRLDHKIVIDISKKHQKKLSALSKEKKYEELWKYVDIHIKTDNIKGSKSEISEDFKYLIIYKPYRVKTKDK
jgi:hypothetical protein